MWLLAEAKGENSCLVFVLGFELLVEALNEIVDNVHVDVLDPM